MSEGKDTVLSVSVTGGKDYKRVFNDVVSAAISKFELVSSALSKVLAAEEVSAADTKFYVEQIKLLLKRAHVELIPGEESFHDKYNMWLLDGYVRMLLETLDMKLITQLLDLDSVLYSIEEASLRSEEPLLIKFALPEKLKFASLRDIDSIAQIAMPTADDRNAYIKSLDNNLTLLTRFITVNKPTFVQIHKKIVSTARKHLHK